MDRPRRPRRGGAARAPAAGSLRERAADADGAARPRRTSRGRGSSRTATYILGIFLVPVAVPDEDRVYYQEIDFVATRERLVSVSKTPPGETAFDPQPAKDACRPDDRVGMFVAHLVENIAERYLDLVDDLDDEIDELEEKVGGSPPKVVGRRLRELRRDLREIRRTLTPTRDAVHKVLDGRIELDATARRHGGALSARRRDRVQRRVRQAAARDGGARVVSRLARRRSRLSARHDRERPERGRQATRR